MPAGRGRAPRPGGRPPSGGHCAAGREQSPTRAKGQRVPPLRRRTAHRAPASPTTRNPAPRPRESAPRRAPTLARAPPPPLGPLGPPRPGPRRRRQRSVTAPLLSCLRSAPCQEGEALLHPGGRGGGLRAAAGAGGPGGGGAGRGGGRTGCGRGASRTAAAAASSRARLNFFVQPGRGAGPEPPRSCRGSSPGTRSGVGGPVPPGSPLLLEQT